MVSRRDVLKLGLAAAASLALGVGAGYAIWGRRPQEAPKAVGEERAAEAEATRTPTTTPAPAEATSVRLRPVKALWIYVGPIGDYGWTHAHHIGKEEASKRLGWLEARHIEQVREAEAYRVIKSELERVGYDAVFATSYGFMDAVKRLAEEFPDVFFYHCSGPWEEFKDLPNVVTYFAEFYQLYYLNGIAAGAVTETCKVGYVPAFLIPEVVRHINAFAIGAVEGAKLMGKCGDGRRLEVYVTPPLESWVAPDKARDSTRILVDRYEVDVVSFTEDTTAVLETAESYWDEGLKVYSFSHYSNMYEYFRAQGRELRSHLTGQVVNWAPIYEYLLIKLAAGIAEKEDVWARLGDFTPIRWRRPVGESRAGSPEGAVYLAPLNTKAIPPRALNRIKELYEAMKELLFEPFTGPLRGYKIDSKGRPQEDVKLKVPPGVRLGRDELWYMDWFHESIISLS